MQIDNKTLPSLAAFDKFKILFETHAKQVTRGALLTPKFSLRRLQDAHYAWLDDLSRVTEREKKLAGGLDHSKQCGHLAYWIRRENPIIDYDDWHTIQEDSHLYEDESQRRDFIAKYGSEFIAFDFGFQICSYYALERRDNPLLTQPKLSMAYLTDVCHMLKFKHVSPHSLYLIYLSLFLNPRVMETVG